MKYLIYISIFFVSMSFYAQDKPRSMSETTEVKTVKIDNGKEVVENKVKVTTKEEKSIKLDKKDAGKVNQDMVVDNDKTITKTIEIDNDSDPFYDSEIELVTYFKDDKEYSFIKNTNGFSVTAKRSEENVGKAYRSNLNSNYYIFNNSDYSGVGYFDGGGNFVIEYYDTDSNSLLTTKFVTLKASK